jgi:Fe-S-cluster-containing hydrogenase component 2
VVDETVCEGCKTCVDACTLGCIHFEGKRRVAAKCDLCQGDPKCVKNCMAKALNYCDINDLKEHIDDEG